MACNLAPVTSSGATRSRPWLWADTWTILLDRSAPISTVALASPLASVLVLMGVRIALLLTLNNTSIPATTLRFASTALAVTLTVSLPEFPMLDLLNARLRSLAVSTVPAAGSMTSTVTVRDTVPLIALTEMVRLDLMFCKLKRRVNWPVSASVIVLVGSRRIASPLSINCRLTAMPPSADLEASSAVTVMLDSSAPVLGSVDLSTNTDKSATALPVMLSSTLNVKLLTSVPLLAVTLTVRLVLSISEIVALSLPSARLVRFEDKVTTAPASTSTVTGVATPVKAALPAPTAVTVTVKTSAPELGKLALSAVNARSSKLPKAAAPATPEPSKGVPAFCPPPQACRPASRTRPASAFVRKRMVRKICLIWLNSRNAGT